MKNKIKSLFLIIFCLFGLTSCNTHFCTNEDEAAIKEALRTSLDKEDAVVGDEIYNRPTISKFNEAKTGVDVSSLDSDADVWEYLGTLGEAGETAKNTYIAYIYTNEHPKACLVTEDYLDPNSGAIIKKKTFAEAFSNGLLDMLAYPASMLFVGGAKLIGGEQPSGAAIFASIVIFTIVLRLAIALLTMKSTKQQQQIQAMQPEVEAINRKYENKFDEKSKQLKSMEIMKLYKKYNVNPLASIVTPFITLPVFIAVYSAVKDSAIIYTGKLGGLSFGAKLGKSIMSGSIFAIGIFLFMAASQFVTMRLPMWLNKKKQKSYKIEKTSGPSQSDMMSYFFLVMILFIGWVLPVALSIYWISSSVYSIGQTLVLDWISKKGDKK